MKSIEILMDEHRTIEGVLSCLSYERVEKEEMGEGAHERLLGIAESLADRFGIAREKAAGGCTCRHGGPR